MKRHYTTGEVAALCGVTLRTVINWIKKGRLQAYQLPGTRGDNRITHEDLLTFMNVNRIPLPAEFLDESKSSLLALVVDDEDNMARAIERVLRRLGYEVLMARNGFQAGQLFAKHSPCLMTLDLQMPQLDGFTVLEQLAAEEDNSCYICVISGMGSTSLDRALAMGANAALSKPFNNDELEEIAQRCLV